VHLDQQDDVVTAPLMDGPGQVLSPLSPKIVEAGEQPNYKKFKVEKMSISLLFA